eukprot:353884-Chlamydomonas_euryale.AAC.3
MEVAGCSVAECYRAAMATRLCASRQNLARLACTRGWLHYAGSLGLQLHPGNGPGPYGPRHTCCMSGQQDEACFMSSDVQRCRGMEGAKA